MSAFVLKWIAILSMLLDHIGSVLLPEVDWLRGVGRLAFPLFAFLLSEGFAHTKSRPKYALRLALFAALSEIPFDLAFAKVPLETEHQNVFFTLLLGFCALCVLERLRDFSLLLGLACCGALAMCAQLLRTDYGWFGVTLILLFYALRDNRRVQMLVFLLLNTGFSLQKSQLPNLNIQLLAAGAALPLACYNGEKGRYSLKYFFYLFYPLHLIILYLLHTARL